MAIRLESTARFCERCGTVLVQRQVEDRLRPCCPACDFVAYLDPKVAAGVIVTLNDEVVLLKRNIEPGFGKWVFPGGYVDAGEPPEKAAVREAWEEVGLDVELDSLLGVFSIEGQRVILMVFTGHVTGGVLQGNFESQAVETFALDAIPWDALAFVTTTAALKTYLARSAPLS
ncbi:MAG: NUDIX hydrolase [Candidatus Latescibacteria bacterium]|nr:NUDIX hydrolase [Candidatus Latescibacterota bacterium]